MDAVVYIRLLRRRDGSACLTLSVTLVGGVE